MVIQVRVSPEGAAAIQAAADEEHTTQSEFCRRAIYRAARFGRVRVPR